MMNGLRAVATPTGVTHLARLWLYVLCGLVLVFLAIPALVVVPMSFSDSTFLEFPPRVVSLRWYETFLQSEAWKAATTVSFQVGLFTVLLATPLGTAAAYSLRFSDLKISPVLLGILTLPMLVPHILIAVGLYFMFSKLGLTNTAFGLGLAHSVLALPFVVIVVLAGLQSFDMTQEKAARILGANRWSAFFRVVLPQIRFPVFASALFAFITSLDEVIIALFLTTGDRSTLTRRMFLSLRDAIDPTIAAISTIFIALAFALALVALSLSGRKG